MIFQSSYLIFWYTHPFYFEGMHQVTKRKITTEKTQENHSIDARYKLLFSQPEIIEDLVRYAIDEKLADSLNFS